MGGVIARGVIAQLHEFKKKFGFFLTLSSPHMGLNFV